MSKLHTLTYAASAGLAIFALAACGKSPEPSETEAEVSEPAEEVAETVASFESLDQKVSYGIGLQMGGQLARDPSITLEIDAFTAGIQDALDGNEPALSQAELMAAFQELQTKAQADSIAAAAENKEIGTAFLEDNAKRPEVKTTDSGLQYEVLSASNSGEKPTAENSVRVHYHGTLLDGTVFDSSVDRGEPIEFPVTGVIPGWIEALQLMDKGDKWKLYIPADLAYGDRATGKIKPGSTLVFEVEILDIL